MNAAILCVGKLREKCFFAAAEEYQKRLSRFGRLEVVELPDLPEPQNASPAQCRQVMDKEGESILARIRPNDFVTALCIDAPQYTSEAFAQALRADEMRPGRHVFVIGGSLGLSDAALRRANDRMSLSRMTFPHQLARVMLLEQTYRACKINAGERYHK